MSKIALNKPVFDSVVAQALEANSGLQASKFHSTINKTNLNSIKQQLQALKELDSLLTEYHHLLEHDLQKLSQTGDQLVGYDAKLAAALLK